MTDVLHASQPSSAALMAWADLWPSGTAGCSHGWTEQLPPGVHALLDETGDDAARWLAVLTGYAAPSQGQVVCAGLNSQLEPSAFQAQVFWHNPRQPLEAREIAAHQWAQSMAQRWPQWSDEAWQAHCEGFGLEPHLLKPLWHLSTGTLRKLGIAAALASGARVTVIEEPIAALDTASIRYLSQALDALGEALASTPEAPRWIIVAHWEPLAGVTWDEVLAPPVLV